MTGWYRRILIYVRPAALGLFLLAALAWGIACSVSRDQPWIKPTDFHPPLLAECGTVIRHGPIFHVAQLPADTVQTISGPMVIRVPDWVDAPLGNYYLYFSGHGGATYIRMAYADSLTGPWTFYDSGVLSLPEASISDGSILFPRIRVDDEAQQIKMFFNWRDREANTRGIGWALSQDGLEFEVLHRVEGMTYTAPFDYADQQYLLVGAAGQYTFRWRGVTEDPEMGPFTVPRPDDPDAPYSRHAGVQRVDDVLRIFFTRKQDAPERILMGTVDLTQDWLDWRISYVVEVLRPEMRYEGVDLPIQRSRAGPARRPLHELRDPAIYEENGRTWLLYTIAGEQGIALAELLF